MENPQLEQFIIENVAALEKLSDMEPTEIEWVPSVIDDLRNFFKCSSHKFKDLPRKKEVNAEVESKVSVSYSQYEDAIRCFNQFDEEGALYHAHLAGNNLFEAKKNGYQLVGYDFLIFLLAGFLAIKFGLCDVAYGFITQLDEIHVLNERLNKVKEVCLVWVRQWLYLTEAHGNGSVVDIWLMCMVGYWFFVIKKPERVEDVNDLENFKKIYALYLKKGDKCEHFRKGTMCDIMRYEFGCLILLVREKTLMYDTRGQLVFRLKGNLAKREIEKKLNCLDSYVRGVNVKDNGCFGFLILLTSGVFYQLIENYDAAVKSFERAREVLSSLENPFKDSFGKIDIDSFESHCQSKRNVTKV